MELTNDLSVEHMPRRRSSIGSDDVSITLPDEFHNVNIKNLSEDELSEKIESILLERVEQGDVLANFQLGQLYFEQVCICAADKQQCICVKLNLLYSLLLGSHLVLEPVSNLKTIQKICSPLCLSLKYNNAS